MEFGLENSRSETLAAQIPFSPRSELDSQSSTVNVLLNWDELVLAQQLTLMISKHFLRIKVRPTLKFPNLERLNISSVTRTARSSVEQSFAAFTRAKYSSNSEAL
jgi:hypothetical protein